MTTVNKLNTLFNSIGVNTIKNEQTSIDIIKEYTQLFFDNKLVNKNYSILNVLGVKNGSGIINHLRNFHNLNMVNDARKALVDKIFLPIANFEELVVVEKKENDTKAKSKLEKNLDKANKKTVVEIDSAIKKSEESIRNNAIRTTANRIIFPTLLLISKGKDFFQFDKNQVKVFLKSLSDEQIKKVFGFDRNKADVNSMNCNLTVLEKLAKAVLINVELQDRTESQQQSEELEVATDEIVASEYSESKAKNMVKSICSMLDYLDNNNSYNEIMDIQRHLEQLENYGLEIADLVEPVRKQGKNLEILGSCHVVEFDKINDLKATNFEELQNKFLKAYSKIVA